MTQEHWQIMLTLWTTQTPLKQTEIVALTLKDQSTISRTLQKMKKEG